MREIECDRHGADGHRDVQDRAAGSLCRGDLRIGHDAVTGAKVDRIGGNLVDTGAGADGLIVDLDAGKFGVFVEPFGI